MHRPRREKSLASGPSVPLFVLDIIGSTPDPAERERPMKVGLYLLAILLVITLLACTKSDSTPPDPLTVTPTRVTLYASQNQQFTASYSGVSWQVNGIPHGNAQYGLIDSTGLYTAPGVLPAMDSLFVTAIRDTMSGKAVIMFAARPSVTLAPDSATLRFGQTRQFTATVTGTDSTRVIWEVDIHPGGNALMGTISATGLYTAPESLWTTPRHRVYAKLAADTTVYGTAVVTIDTTARY